MLHPLILALIWTFNLSAVLFAYRADWLKQLVLRSWELICLLVAVELAWAVWALVSGQPIILVVAACWLGINLLVTVNLARRHAAEMNPEQVVLMCAWWLGLAGMCVAAFLQAGFL